ncbi:MAG: TrmH family RNA methyltransferase [Pyrinomonadaceae bacterium]
MMNITSRDNSLLRHARAVRDGKVRDSIFVEGLRLCEEALRSDLRIEAIIFSDQIANKERAAALIAETGNIATKSASVSERLLASISYTKTPQGIIVLASRPTITEKEFAHGQTETALLVILHGINNPVNLGAILRTAEAAGATGVLTTAGTTDPFSPKSLRGAMGAAFRLPIWTDVSFDQAIKWCRKRSIQAVCADVHATRSYADVDWRRPTALIVGAESKGLSDDEIKAADEAVKIPMKGLTESLNVAVAAGILLYEAERQRG